MTHDTSEEHYFQILMRISGIKMEDREAFQQVFTSIIDARVARAAEKRDAEEMGLWAPIAGHPRIEI